MKKLVLGSAIVAVLNATGAQAVINVDANNLPIIDPAQTNVIYLSGASAAINFIDNLITSSTVPAVDKICDTSKPVWKYKDSVTGSDQNAYLCERSTTNPSLPTNKPNVLVMKRSAGGSAFGVSPIIAEANGDSASATIAFLKISTACTSTVSPVAGTTLGQITCPYDLADASKVTMHIADFGISDVDPGQFIGNNAPAGYSDVTADDVAKLTVKSASALTFGVPVTKNLYFALQAAQIANGTIPASAGCAVGSEAEACMPSLSSAQVASIHSGNWADWNQLKVFGSTGLFDWVAANAPAYKPDVSYLHTCRRENGSGTQAQSNIKFLGDPCTVASSATAPASDALAQGFSEGDGFPMIHENNTSGSVGNCLDELDDGSNAANGFNNIWGKRWAVGIQSLEKKTSASSKFRFVKVDGVAPTLANVASGKYRDWAENTFQYWTDHQFSANATENTALKKLTDALIKSAGAPEVMAALNTGYTHTFGAAGAYLAVPTNFTPEANGAFLASRPVNQYSHATSTADTNNCRVPTVYNFGDAKL
jgi:hypothetical protein